ncbi:MAG: MBL fold metallo-hydrolase [Deltaproteobacteria bacterium]|nr:MBL fold metallo-hydrolase [Deltaproteobacteria bacterium]
MRPSSDERQRREQQLLERIKELDLAHRNRLSATGAGQTLSLRYLRRALAQFVSRPAAPTMEDLDTPEASAMMVSPVGHATVHIVSAKARILTDPWLSQFLYGLRRSTAPAITPTDLARVTCILISHGHRDHLHPPSLQRLPKDAVVIAPPGFARDLSRLGFPQVVELGADESCQHGDVTITAVPARHEGGNGKQSSANGYIIQAPEVAVFFAGDTGYFSGFSDIGRRFRPDLALLPISGYSPLPLRATHMSPLDAAYALEDLDAKVLVPISYGIVPLGYEPLDEPPRWLRAACESRGLLDRLAMLGPGERLTVRRTPAASVVA